MVEPKVPPPPPPFDMAKWKQADYAAGEAWEKERAYAAYRAGETALPTGAARTQGEIGQVIKATHERFVLTDGIILRGGVGTPVSYGQKAEDSYTGHSYGGQGLPAVKAVGLINTVLVWARDNTPLLTWMRDIGLIHNSASAAIFYEDKEFPPVYAGGPTTGDTVPLAPTSGTATNRGGPLVSLEHTILMPGGRGVSITAVQLSNLSEEVLSMRYVWVDLYLGHAELPYTRISAYPYGYPTISSPDFNMIQAGDIFRLALDQIDVPPGIRAELRIGVRSESGRYGEIAQEVVP
jgi:hypothetical protein